MKKENCHIVYYAHCPMKIIVDYHRDGQLDNDDRLAKVVNSLYNFINSVCVYLWMDDTDSFPGKYYGAMKNMRENINAGNHWWFAKDGGMIGQKYLYDFAKGVDELGLKVNVRFHVDGKDKEIDKDFRKGKLIDEDGAKNEALQELKKKTELVKILNIKPEQYLLMEPMTRVRFMEDWVNSLAKQGLSGFADAAKRAAKVAEARYSPSSVVEIYQLGTGEGHGFNKEIEPIG